MKFNYFTIVARNGRILAHSETYDRKNAARLAIGRIRGFAQGAALEERTK